MKEITLKIGQHFALLQIQIKTIKRRLLCHSSFRQLYSLRFFVMLIAVTQVTTSPAQIHKPAIDTGVLGKWQSLVDARISSHGKFAAYTVEQSSGDRTLFIQDTSGSWKRQYQGVDQCLFSGDQQAIFQKGDSLHFLLLGDAKPSQRIRIRSFLYPALNKPFKWIAYQGTDMSLTLQNLVTNDRTNLGPVSDYVLGRMGKQLILQAITKSDDKHLLEWVDLNNKRKQIIWSGLDGEKAQNFNFDREEKQLLFSVTSKAPGRNQRSIWYYQPGMEKAVLLINNDDERITKDLQLQPNAEFSAGGKWVFLQLLQPKPEAIKPNPDAVMVDVWSYKDRVIQPEQVFRAGFRGPKTFTAVIDVHGQHFQQLENDDQELLTRAPQITGDAVVMKEPTPGSKPDPNNFMAIHPSYYVRSLIDGSSRELQTVSWSLEHACFSPTGRWLIYYDQDKSNYFSYDVRSGSLHDLTGGLPTKVSKDYVLGTFPPAVDGIVGWEKSDEGVLLYDNYDLWQLDPAGIQKAKNITEGYGAQHHVKFRLIKGNNYGNSLILKDGDKLLLTGFNVDNKYNGYFQLNYGQQAQPRLLTMGPYTYYQLDSQKPGKANNDFEQGMPAIKASDTDCWLVWRCSATDAPNWYITSNFKSFRPLTLNSPQSKYNWLNAELINWKQLDGTSEQGVLYKPEDFDPKKRYPVIFNYYQLLSFRLYQFPKPEWTIDNINIPWFVSKGYLVFIPDIHITIANESGKTNGMSAYNSIVSAARHLSKLPYVDGQKMAIQGHSFGGYITNYLVTHTGLFAAAAEMAGTSDFVSSYLTLMPPITPIEWQSRIALVERGQGSIGATLWQRPDLYLEQSSVLHADKVTTPLLITHNQLDGGVPWRQGVEFYMALRRLGKPVWMIQYDGQGHSFSYNTKEAKDYTIRLTQFFDYYLKGMPPPTWMTEGIPARLKGIKTGLEPDMTGAKP